MARKWAAIQVLGHLATDDKHEYDDHHVFAVFLIQNTQNRDSKAIHLKLDELIRAVEGARNRLVHLEELSDDELEALHKQFKRIQAVEAATGRHAEGGEPRQDPQGTNT